MSKRKSTTDHRPKRQKTTLPSSPSAMDELDALERELDAEQAMSDILALEEALKMPAVLPVPQLQPKRQSRGKTSLQALLEKDKQSQLLSPTNTPSPEQKKFETPKGESTYRRPGTSVVPSRLRHDIIASVTPSPTPLNYKAVDQTSPNTRYTEAMEDLDALLTEVTPGRMSTRTTNNPLSSLNRLQANYNDVAAKTHAEQIEAEKAAAEQRAAERAALQNLTIDKLLSRLFGGEWPQGYRKVDGKSEYWYLSSNSDLRKVDLLKLNAIYKDGTDTEKSVLGRFPEGKFYIKEEIKGQQYLSIHADTIDRDKLLRQVEKQFDQARGKV